MAQINCVSVILFVGSRNVDEQIWKAARALGKSEWRAEILLVEHPDGHRDLNSPQQRITYRPNPQKFSCLEEAIGGAKHPYIVVPDPNVELDSEAWSFLTSHSDRASLVTAYYSKPSIGGYKRILVWIYALIVRLLLRTGKNELRSGVTFFRCGDLKAFSEELTKFNLPGPGSAAFETTRLVACWRLHGRQALEIEIGSAPIDAVPNSKSIFKRTRRAIRFWWNAIMFPAGDLHGAQTSIGPWKKRAACLLLFVMAGLLFFSSLGFPLFEPDEARNAQLALNVVESGDWLSLSLAEKSYWDKPPAQIWAIAASYKIFGPSPWSTRFPIALASLFTVCLTVLLGQRLVGFRAAWLGAAVLMLSSGFVLSGRYVTMDASLTLVTLVFLLAGYSATQRRFKRRHAIAAGIACGIGLLIKGPVVAVIAVPPLLVAHWLSVKPIGGNRNGLGRYCWAWFLVPVILIAAPWYIATMIVQPEFASYFFWKHHVVRFSNAFNHRQPFYYYWIGIFLFMFPASYLLPTVIKFVTSRKLENRVVRTPQLGFLLLSTMWILTFFSLSDSKLPAYILPAFPLVALMMGVVVEQRIFFRWFASSEIKILGLEKMALATSGTSQPKVGKKSFLDGLPYRAPAELVFWLGLFCGVSVFVYQANNYSLWLVFGAGCISGLAGLLAAHRFSKPKWAWISLAAVGLCFVVVATHQFVPAFAKSRSIHHLAFELQGDGEFEDAPVVFFGRESYGSSLTLEDSRTFFFDETESRQLANFLEASPRAIIVSSQEPMDILRLDLSWAIRLKKCDGTRHLYLSQPDQRLFAHRKSKIRRR